jgi:hypothetical protein
MLIGKLDCPLLHLREHMRDGSDMSRIYDALPEPFSLESEPIARWNPGDESIRFCAQILNLIRHIA